MSNALAQPYNHTILPLGNDRDGWTQIKWGIADFEARFGRKPHGMWLPETAVDLRVCLQSLFNQSEKDILSNDPRVASTPQTEANERYFVTETL